MTLKYPAVIDHPAIAPFYSFLHIPIDSIIYEEAKHSVTGIGVSAHRLVSPGRASTKISTRIISSNYVTKSLVLILQLPR